MEKILRKQASKQASKQARVSFSRYLLRPYPDRRRQRSHFAPPTHCGLSRTPAHYDDRLMPAGAIPRLRSTGMPDTQARYRPLGVCATERAKNARRKIDLSEPPGAIFSRSARGQDPLKSCVFELLGFCRADS